MDFLIAYTQRRTSRCLPKVCVVRRIVHARKAVASFSKSEQAGDRPSHPAERESEGLEAPAYESGSDLGTFLIVAREFCPTALGFQQKIAGGRTNIGTIP
jgi:hypothetical protein